MKRTPKVLAALLITALAVPIGLAASGVASAHHVEGGCDRPGVWEVENSEGGTAGTFTTNRHGAQVFNLPAGGTTEVPYAGNSITITTSWANGVGPVSNTLTGDCAFPGGDKFIETSHTVVCGSATVTLRNVSNWIYPVSFTEDGGAPFYGATVDNRTDTDGNGTKDLNGPIIDASNSRTFTYAEDTGQRTVTYVVNAGTENDLYVGQPAGTLTTITVETDCTPPPSEEKWECSGYYTRGYDGEPGNWEPGEWVFQRNLTEDEALSFEDQCGLPPTQEEWNCSGYYTGGWDWNGQGWDPGELVKQRDLTEAERDEFDCDTNAEVLCTSSGPDYVSWQITNTGNVDIVSPLALAPGESGVDESLKNEQGSVAITVEFANGTSGEFVGSGEGCVFTPPPTTEPPVTTPPVTEPPVTDPPSTEPPVTEPPTTTTPPVGRPPIPTTTPPAFTGTLPETL